MPKESQISNLSYGYLLVTQGENFTRWHSDFTEATDCLITLYGQGEKFWFFAPPGSVAKQLEDGYIFAYQFKECIEQYSDKITFCKQRVGDSVYLPYGWLHSVVTVNNIGGCTSSLSVGLKVPEERRSATWKLVTNNLPLGKRRQIVKEAGPVSYFYCFAKLKTYYDYCKVFPKSL